MGPLTMFSYFFGFWTTVYVVDVGLRNHPYTKQWYQELTTKFGISFHLLQARFFTQRLNRIFQFVCRFHFIPWNAWFSCGAIFSLLFMVLSFVFLSLLLINMVSRKPTDGTLLTPVMPGINLPSNQMGFYLFTLLLCAFLHEAGHALAALRERVRLHGFGLFLFGFYPGAYVDLNTADLQSLTPFSQLRVYCAGVWHNAVIALLSVFVFYTLPVLLSPFYHVGSGVSVTYLRENSVVTGHRGLSVGDHITRVNACPVANQSDWVRCLEEAYARPTGYCLSWSHLTTLDASSIALTGASNRHRHLAALVQPQTTTGQSSGQNVDGEPTDLHLSGMDCCPMQLASTHLCFNYTLISKVSGGAVKQRSACLPARTVTERTSCRVPNDCASAALGPQSPPSANGRPPGSLTLSGGSAQGGAVSSANMMCVIPNPGDQQTRLVRLVHSRKEALAVLFLGPLEDLFASVGVSDYVSRWPNLFSPSVPLLLGLFCVNLFSLSGALVVLNVVPCYALDGQWILQAFLDLWLGELVPCRHRRRTIFRCIMLIGSTLLSVNLGLAFWHFFVGAHHLGDGSLSAVDAVAVAPPAALPLAPSS